MATTVELLLIGLFATVAAADLAAAVIAMPLLVMGMLAADVGVMARALVRRGLAMFPLAGHSRSPEVKGVPPRESGTPSRGKGGRAIDPLLELSEAGVIGSPAFLRVCRGNDEGHVSVPGSRP